ncbi:MAG TPA: Mur ligase family protein, partial [Gemmatimonadales bacterium]|nr:Mur ligase family protein [Gemmatimonadales bacterium]
MILDSPLQGADQDLWARWRGAVAAMAATSSRAATSGLDWPTPSFAVRPHATGTTLAFTAPVDALLTATSVNEWALVAAAESLGIEYDRSAIVDEIPPIDQAAAIAWFVERAAAERGSVPEEIITDMRPGMPIALVTGSNGKTTTTRLIAAMLRSQGHVVGYCCTDGVFIGDEMIASGDYSGPEGARRVLTDRRVTAAVLETARGGLLRRGLVVPRADAAVITNVAGDHFGDYGIDSLEDLARVK